MFRRHKKKKNRRADTVAPYDQDTMAEILEYEERFKNMLNPIETYVMMSQSILVWENVQYTSVVFAVVNILFWLATTMRIYHLIGLTGLAVVFADMWTNKIWPEIRVPLSPDADMEGWTPVHPRLLSVPELSHHAATYLVLIKSYTSRIWYLREYSKFKFTCVMVLILSCTTALGHYVSGIILLYVIVMCLFGLPGIAYHNLLQKTYEHIEPVIFRMETSFNVKRKKKTKSKGRGKKKGGDEGSRSLESSRTDFDSESDLELNEFVPSFDSSALEQSLLKAAHNESDDESTGHTPGLLTPASLSRGGSPTHSDLDADEEDLSLTPRLKKMPGLDDSHLEDSCDENGSHINGSQLTVPDIDVNNSDSDVDLTTLAPDSDQLEKEVEVFASATQPMHFKEGHYKEPSSSSESDVNEAEKLHEGLAFPDFTEDSPDSPTAPEGIVGQMAQQVTSAINAAVVQQTVSTLMTSTMSGFSLLTETMKAARGGQMASDGLKEDAGSAASVQYPAEQSGSSRPVTRSQTRSMTESIESDILAEFEFLDDEDLDVDVDEPASSSTKKSQ